MEEYTSFLLLEDLHTGSLAVVESPTAFGCKSGSVGGIASYFDGKHINMGKIIAKTTDTSSGEAANFIRKSAIIFPVNSIYSKEYEQEQPEL